MEEYTAKLTGEPFLYNETKIIAEYLLEGYSVEELKIKNVEENLIQHNRERSIIRSNAPIFRRLNVMNDELMREFVFSDIETSKFILLYTIMKTDKLVKEFVFEVYYEKLRLREKYISKFDVNNWYEEKLILSQYLRERSESTTSKLKQVILKIMQDSDLVQKEKDKFKIKRPLLSEKYISLLTSLGDYDYAKAIGGLL